LSSNARQIAVKPLSNVRQMHFVLISTAQYDKQLANNLVGLFAFHSASIISADTDRWLLRYQDK
jgi:hypothetical protein